MMFAYISKINHKDIVCLYYDVDDDDGGDSSGSGGSEYLFNTQTIAEWAKWAKGDEIEVCEDIPRFFAYS
jgi:hypothetical protein